MKVSTPGAPRVPNSTPVSTRAALRAPIHNPYDKFSQPEFDAWIGDITTVLKRALGHEAPVLQPWKPSTSLADTSAFDEEVAEDSFAEIKARRAAKGKQRAVDEEDEEEFEVEASILHQYDEEEDSDNLSFSRSSEQRYNSDEEDNVEAEPAHTFTNTADSPIELLSSDEEEEDVQEASRYSDDQYSDIRTYREGSAEDEEEYEDDEDDDGIILQHEQEEVVEDEFIPEDEDGPDAPSPELPDVWAGPRMYAEDLYTGGDVPQGSNNVHHLSEMDEVTTDTEEDVAEVNMETFPPRDASSRVPLVELPDKWEGPRAYAKHFYAGGDQTEKSLLSDTPSHLTPTILTLRNDSSQPLSDNTTQGPFETIDVDSDSDETTVGPPPIFSMPPEATANLVYDRDYEDSLASPTDAGDSIAPLFAAGQPSANSQHSRGLADVPITPEKAASGSRFVPHDRSLSPVRVSPMGHIDWNFPPAFPAGVLVSPSKARISSIPEAIELSDDEDDEESVHLNGQSDGEDGEDEDDDPAEAIPVGISNPSQADNTDGVSEARSTNTRHPTIQPGSNDLDIFSNGNSFSEVFQEPVETIDAEVEGIYTSGGVSDDFTATNQESTQQEHFEPLSIPDIGFGDLPSDEVDQDAPKLLSAQEFFDNIADFDGMEGLEADSRLEQTAFIDDLSSLPTHSGDVINADTMTQAIAVDNFYSVSEPPEALLEEQDVAVEASSVIDITDEAVGDVQFAEGVVEEVVTEGRRTEEPEHALSVDDVTFNAQNTVVSTADVPVNFGIIVADETRWAVETVEDASEHVNETSILASVESTTLEIADGDHDNSRAVEQAVSKEQTNSISEQNSYPLLAPSVGVDSDEDMLRPGIPMPISADPNVPDPTSLHTSPMLSPQPSAADEAELEQDNDDQGAPSLGTTIASAIPPTLLKHFSGHRTVSGLFTPLSEGSSCSPPPSAQDGPENVTAETPDPVPATSPVDSTGATTFPPEEVTEGAQITDDAVAEDTVAVANHVEGHASIAPTEHNAQEASPHLVNAAPGSPILSAEAPSPTLARIDANVDADADADGDDDPDYEPTAAASPALDPPDVLHSVDHAVLPLTFIPEVSDEELPTEVDDSSIPEKQNTPMSSPTVSVDGQDASSIQQPASVDQNDAGEAAAPDASPSSQTGSVEEPLPSRPQKRKRVSPAPSMRFTRSRSSKHERDNSPDTVLEHSEKSKGKQKAGEEAATPEAPEPVEGSSDAEYNGLNRNGSRASSVASASTSELSVPTLPSPTLQLLRLQPAPSLPLMHTHGSTHSYSVVIQQPAPKLPSPPPLPLAVPVKEGSRPPSPQPAEPAAERSPPKPVPPPMLPTTPVTRSNCRFHKISLPQEDTATRMYFAVPGCSLNHELMEAEDIQDHGHVTNDETRLPDVESLGLDSYVLGLLRQLVGVDLVREQEVYFLPQEGDRYRRPRKSFKPRVSGIDSISSRLGSSSTAAQKKAKSTLSSVGSRSASVARSDRMSTARSGRTAGTSISDNEDSDDENESQTGRSKRASSKAPSVASSSGTATTERSKRPIRRSRRLQPDALAYKPSAESDEDSSADEHGTKGGRGRATRRGTKRSRTVDEPAEDDVSKKRRVERSPAVDSKDDKDT